MGICASSNEVERREEAPAVSLRSTTGGGGGWQHAGEQAPAISGAGAPSSKGGSKYSRHSVGSTTEDPDSQRRSPRAAGGARPPPTPILKAAGATKKYGHKPGGFNPAHDDAHGRSSPAPEQQQTQLASLDTTSGPPGKQRTLSLDVASTGTDDNFLRVASSPKAGSHNHSPASSPTHGRSGSREHDRHARKFSRRSSEGRRLLAEASFGGGDARRATGESRRATGDRPGFGGSNLATSGSGAGAGTFPAPLSPQHMPSNRRVHSHRKSSMGGLKPRRTSNNGMMSRLALQFPLVRTSFLAVYRAFEKYMLVVAQVERRRTVRAMENGLALPALVMLKMENSVSTRGGSGAGGSGAAATGGAAVPLSKQSTESRLDSTAPNQSTAAAPHHAAHPSNSSEMSTVAPTHTHAFSSSSTALADIVSAPAPLVSALESLSEEEQRAHEIRSLLPPSLLESALQSTAAPTASADATADPSAATPAATTDSEDAAIAAAAAAAVPLPSVSPLRVKQLGTLSAERLGDALQAVTGAPEPLPPAELAALVAQTDLDGSKTISFREFLVAVALGYFLKEDIERDRKARQAAAAAHTRTAASDPAEPLHLSAAAPSPRLGASSNGGVASDVPPVALHNNFSSGALAPATMTADTAATAGSGRTGFGHSKALSLSVASRSSHPSSPAPFAGLPPPLLAADSSANLLQPVHPRPTSSHGGGPPQAHSRQSSRSGAASSSSTPFASVARGFRVVYNAFLEMDADGSESVDLSELKRALFSAAPTRADEALLERRFSELDFDKGGSIDLAEFLYGVVAWVGLMEDDEDPDDPTAQGAAARAPSAAPPSPQQQ